MGFISRIHASGLANYKTQTYHAQCITAKKRFGRPITVIRKAWNFYCTSVHMSKNAFPTIRTLYLTVTHPPVSNKCLHYPMVQQSEKETTHWHSILRVRLQILIFLFHPVFQKFQNASISSARCPPVLRKLDNKRNIFVLLNLVLPTDSATF